MTAFKNCSSFNGLFWDGEFPPVKSPEILSFSCRYGRAWRSVEGRAVVMVTAGALQLHTRRNFYQLSRCNNVIVECLTCLVLS